MTGTVIVIEVFIPSYVAISVEHKIKIDGAASALVTGMICRLLYFLNAPSVIASEGKLIHHL